MVDISISLFQEILEDGTSREVESTRQSEQYQAMKVWYKIAVFELIAPHLAVF